MRTVLTLALGGLMLAGAATAQELPEGNPEQGEALVSKCQACHGSDGIAKLVIAPNIAGEPEGYLAEQMVAFREGTRENPMMSLAMADIPDQDIADLAAWFASQNVVATLEADPSGAPTLCVACHGDNGISNIPNAPNLAGDSAMYLEEQMIAFRDVTRVSDVMNTIAADLTDEEIADAVAWYSEILLEVE